MYIENSKRELLLIKDNYFTKYLMHQEIKKLNNLLTGVETLYQFYLLAEMFDFRKYKIIKRPETFVHILRRLALHPFVFVIVKN